MSVPDDPLSLPNIQEKIEFSSAVGPDVTPQEAGSAAFPQNL
jgi:hypothetical protein